MMTAMSLNKFGKDNKRFKDKAQKKPSVWNIARVNRVAGNR